MSDRTCEHYDEYDVSEPTTGEILNTLAECGLGVMTTPPSCEHEKTHQVDVTDEWNLGCSYHLAQVKSRTSAEDALRRAWSRRKVQKIVEERMK